MREVEREREKKTERLLTETFKRDKERGRHQKRDREREGRNKEVERWDV